MNGRFGDDKFKGAMTFRNCSVIDYSNVSHQLLKHIQDFSITELDPIFTDVHSLIHTSLKYKTVNTSNNTRLRADTHNQKRPKWKQENKLEFLNNIDKSKINVFCNQIHDARVNINLVTEETITDICNQISNIFMESDSLTYQDRYNLLKLHVMGIIITNGGLDTSFKAHEENII